MEQGFGVFSRVRSLSAALGAGPPATSWSWRSAEAAKPVGRLVRNIRPMELAGEVLCDCSEHNVLRQEVEAPKVGLEL